MQLPPNPQVILSWKAPLRPYVKRNPNVLRFYFAIAILLGSIVFFLGDRILLIPIGTLLFLFYVLTVTPPQEVEHKITKFGIEAAGGTIIRYEDLAYFYFSRRFGYDVLTTVTHGPFWYYNYLVVPDEEVKRKIVEILSAHLVYQERPDKAVVDKVAEWFTTFVAEESERGESPTVATSTGQTSGQASL